MKRSKPVEVKPHVVEIGAEEVAAQSKIIEHAVTKESLVREFGEQGLRENSDGSWEYSLPTKNGHVEKKTLKLAQEMDQRRARAEVAAGQVTQSKAKTETIRNANGEKVQVPAHMAERLDRHFHEQRRRR